MTEMANFEIELGPIGVTSLKIGDEAAGVIEISELVAGVQINANGDNPTTVIVKQLASQAKITGRGIVYVHKEQIDVEAVLEMIDPVAFNHEIMGKMDWGESRTPGEIALDLIKEKIHAARP